MRELAIARETARDHWYLAPLLLALGVVLVWIYVEPDRTRSARELGANAIASIDASGPDFSAWTWGLAALVPVSLWAGVVAGATPRPMLHMLARPVARGRLLAGRVMGVAVPILGAAAVFAFLPVELDPAERPLPSFAIVVASIFAFVAGALGGMARDDDPFALAIGVLLFSVQASLIVAGFAVLGVGVHRPFFALGQAALPCLVVTMLVASWPMIDHWRSVLPRRGAFALRRGAIRWTASTAILTAGWFAVGAWAGRPARGETMALIGLAGDGRMWVGTGAARDPMLDAVVDGVILLEPDGTARDVAAWSGAGELWDLGTRGEVVELTASPTGEHVAAVLKGPRRIEILGEGGIVARAPLPELGSSGAGGRWSADGRRFAWVSRDRESVQAGVVDMRGGDGTTSTYDVTEANVIGVLSICEDVVVLGHPEQSTVANLSLESGETTVPVGLGDVPTARSGAQVRFTASPSGCRIARAIPAADSVHVMLLDPRDREGGPDRTLELPLAGVEDVWSLVWLDERHLVLDVGELSGGEFRLVIRDDGSVVSERPIRAARWGIAAAFGPPDGPLLLRSGSMFWAIDRDGAPIWQLSSPRYSAEALGGAAVVEDGRLMWFSRGEMRQAAAPWIERIERIERIETIEATEPAK